jgi:hypothetical protein
MTRLRVRRVGNVKKRHLAKYAAYVLEEEQAYQLGLLCLLFAKRARRRGRARMARKYLMLSVVAAARVEQIDRDIDYISQPVARRYLTFATANANNFTAFFRFKLDDMPRLMRCLRIPAYFTLDNGAVVNGQEGLMVALRLLAYPLLYIDVEDFFGWENTRLCRIKNWVIKYIYKKHRHRVQDYLHWHAKYIKQSKSAIRAYKTKLSPTGTLAHRTRNVAWIIDGYRCSVCRPSQPAGQQVGVPQPHIDLQCLVYNRWKKVHVTTPYGLIADFAGPIVGKWNDLNLLASSNILHRFRVALINEGLNPADFDMIGDKLYIDRPNLWRLYKNPMFEQAAVDNTIESEPRTAVEWVNGRITANWKGLQFKAKQKLRLAKVGRHFIVAAVLTNAHNLLLGGQTMNQFFDINDPLRLEMPSLEDYFEMP